MIIITYWLINPCELYKFLQFKHSLVVSVNPKNISVIIEHSFWNSVKKKLNALILSYWLRGWVSIILFELIIIE